MGWYPRMNETKYADIILYAIPQNAAHISIFSHRGACVLRENDTIMASSMPFPKIKKKRWNEHIVAMYKSLLFSLAHRLDTDTTKRYTSVVNGYMDTPPVRNCYRNTAEVPLYWYEYCSGYQCCRGYWNAFICFFLYYITSKYSKWQIRSCKCFSQLQIFLLFQACSFKISFWI